MKITISKADFLSLTPPEQNWTLYAGIQQIDAEGCEWSKKNYRTGMASRLQLVGASVGGGLGFMALAGKLLGVF